MKASRCVRPLWSALLALVLASLAGAGANGEGDSLRFLTDASTVRTGRTQVIAFEAPEPLAADARPTFTVEGDVLLVVRVPEILAGERYGYLRVHGLRPGVALVRIGDDELRVHVEPRAFDPPEVVLTSPVPGAVLFGTIAVGVEVRTLRSTSRLPIADVRLRVTSELLRAPLELDPVKELDLPGPDRRFVFELATDALTAGPLALVAEWSPRASDATPVVRSAPAFVRVVHPRAEDRMVAECEEHLDHERPDGFPRKTPAAGRSGDGRGFCVQSRSDQPWMAPLRVHAAGAYQLVLTARGDHGAGALPSVGVGVDSARSSSTMGRVVDLDWRRTAIGRPVELRAGEHALSLHFLNDRSFEATMDRNLYLDRIELLRVEPPVVEEAGARVSSTSGYDAARVGLSIASMISGGIVGAAFTGDGEEARAVEAAADVMGTPRFGSGGLNVALDRALDGEQVNGRLRVAGTCRWDDHPTAPLVELVVNGRTLDTQQAARPRFLVDRAVFRAGANELYLRARLGDGRTAETPTQTLRVDEPDPDGPRRAFHRFEVADERWSSGGEPLGDLRVPVRGQAPLAYAELPVGRELAFPLPPELEGVFQLRVEAQARGKGTRRVQLDVVDTRAEVVFGPKGFGPRNRIEQHSLGRIELARGDKVVRLRATGEGERKVEVFSLMLTEVDERPDRRPPTARLVWPREGARLGAADTCVVEAWDDDRLAEADVWIDGKPRGTFGHLPDGSGAVVLPLLTTDLDEGEHTLVVRVRDGAGNVGESTPITVEVTRDEVFGPHARAIHLLNRFAYGPEPRALARLLRVGEERWLADELGALSAGDLAALGAAEARLNDASSAGIERAAVRHALRTNRPARTRLCLWIENHFSTWIEKARASAEWSEHKRFLDLGAAPFGELLWASVTSPAMLRYLDQDQSFGSRLNENYARELLELHSLGVDGGYDQRDVTELASLLSGLTLAVEALPNGQAGALMQSVLRFDPLLNDARQREILGLRFAEGGPDALFDRVRLAVELFAAHPATARNVVRSLVEHYVAVTAPDELVTDLVPVFLATGGDLKAVLLDLARHPRFWTERTPRIATPIDYALSLARAADVPTIDYAVSAFLQKSGMGVFGRETPDGYPEEDAAWVDTNATIQRRWLVDEIPYVVRRLVAPQATRSPVGDPRTWHARLVDLVALRLNGHPLPDPARRAAIEYLESLEDDRQKPFEAARFVAQLPATNTR